ncbi:hypothetical protein PHLGIDRAFT_20141 [Phlebiopsis gigantea 11061_1 CR5-6]|uniref:Uncharacterized protein n=1 Tax=Phlebiopsis gigantea (strain 11061_1 CR5-6) TaxID=745531 RepID=A0A0C3RTB1_PHLG1|nr:hypothetical protein PHLGIDRAFT_20141 [Phlebiopsis gigantea 11061_1 CR5-6]
MSDSLLKQISSGAGFKIKGRATSTVVGRAEIENQSITTPKPIYGAGRTDMLWTFEDVNREDNTCIIKCGGAPVSEKDGLLWAFTDNVDNTTIDRWSLRSPFVQGSLLVIVKADSTRQWLLPDPETGRTQLKVGTSIEGENDEQLFEIEALE